MLKLYDNCLIFILEKHISIDRLPPMIQNDIFALRRYYQAICAFEEKSWELRLESYYNFRWWEDEQYDNLSCEEYDECLYCCEWKKIEEEKESRDLYLEKMYDDEAKAEHELEEAKIKIPTYLSHLTDKIESLTELDIYQESTADHKF